MGGWLSDIGNSLSDLVNQTAVIAAQSAQLAQSSAAAVIAAASKPLGGSIPGVPDVGHALGNLATPQQLAAAAAAAASGGVSFSAIADVVPDAPRLSTVTSVANDAGAAFAPLADVAAPVSSAAGDAVGYVRSPEGGLVLAAVAPEYAVLTESGRQGLIAEYGPIITAEASAAGGPAAGSVVGAGVTSAQTGNYQTALPIIATAAAQSQGVDPAVIAAGTAAAHGDTSGLTTAGITIAGQQAGIDPMAIQAAVAAQLASIDPATIQAMIDAEVRQQIQAGVDASLANSSAGLAYAEANASNLTPAQLEALAIQVDGAPLMPSAMIAAVDGTAAAITQEGSGTLPPSVATGVAAAEHAAADSVVLPPLMSGQTSAQPGPSPDTLTPASLPPPPSTSAAYLAAEAAAGTMSPAQLEALAESLDAAGGQPQVIATPSANAAQGGDSGSASPAPAGSSSSTQMPVSSIPKTTPANLTTAAFIGFAVLVALVVVSKK